MFPSAGNTLMVHYEGGVEVELRSSFDGVGGRAQKSRGIFKKKFPRLYNTDYFNIALYPFVLLPVIVIKYDSPKCASHEIGSIYFVMSSGYTFS